MNIFDVDFMPHGHCYFWHPAIVWSHALADLIIAISYFIIPYALIKLIKQRPDLRYKNIFLLFGVFIVACGSTHILSIINIWHPFYKLDAIVKIITAVASLPTAIILLKIIPQAVKIPTLQVWEALNNNLQQQIEELKEKDQTIEKVREFEFLANSIPQIVWTSTPTGEPIYFNQHFLEYTGLSKENVNQASWLSVVHSQDTAYTQKIWAECVAERRIFEVEYRFRRFDGQYRWHLVRAVPMKDENGAIVKWFGTCTDIHDLKVAQEQINEVSHRFQTVINNAPVIIWAVDSKGYYTMSQGKALESVHLKPNEVVGLSCFELLRNHPGNWISNINKALQGEIVTGIDEFGERVFETSFLPIRDQHDKITGMVGISLDITTTKKAESESQFKSRFLASMSHEIRTPLNAVMGFANVLKKTDLDEDQKQYVQLINQSGELLLKLIGDILDLSKIEEGKLEISEESFDLAHDILASLNPYKFKAETNGLSFDIEVDPNIPGKVVGDKHRINQVLINLVGNALKFTKHGRILVKIEELTSSIKDTSIRFSVADSGIGVPPNKQQDIFQSFTQGDKTIHKQYGGSGLGLSIAKELVALMGGELMIQSPHTLFPTTQGSCFSFVIKLKKEVKEEPANQETKNNFVFHPPLTILVAEDNSVNQILARIVLRNIGCQVDFANNGMECLEMLAQRHYDCVLMDIQMPVLDGLEATLKIRNELKSTIPIVGLSANVYKEDIIKSIKAGMNVHIGKPYTEETIYNAIKKSISMTITKDTGSRITNLDYILGMTKDKSELAAVLRQALEQADNYSTRINDFYRREDWKNLGFQCHAYKSSARIIGATALQQRLGELEHAADRQDERKIRVLFDSLAGLFREVKQEIEHAIASLS